MKHYFSWRSLGHIAAWVAISAAMPGQTMQAPNLVRPAGLVWVLPSSGGPQVLYSSIQEAVDAAVTGDTVLLGSGEFRGNGNRNVFVSGKDLRIEHRGDPKDCVIDGEGLGIGFTFRGTGVTNKTILHGVTIMNGQGGLGGGIRCDNGATPTIEMCSILACRALVGGGIYYLVDPAVAMHPGEIRDCTIQGNFATSGSGGLHMAYVNVDRCRIADNTSNFDGGGIGIIGVFGSIRNSVIVGNMIPGPAPSPGGGITVQAFQCRIESCTVAHNRGGMGGGIAFFNGDPSATMTNTIVWGNESPFTAPQIWHMTAFGTSVATIRHCDIEGGAGGIVVLGMPPNISTIFDLDPEFLGGSAGDFQLSPGSPLVDLGDPLLADHTDEGDFQLEPRRSGPIDLGADEVHLGPALSLPSPGRAGELNTWVVRNAPPGSSVLFLAGRQANPGQVLEPCSLTSPGIAGRRRLGLRLATEEGTATLRAFVPSGSPRRGSSARDSCSITSPSSALRRSWSRSCFREHVASREGDPLPPETRS